MKKLSWNLDVTKTHWFYIDDDFMILTKQIVMDCPNLAIDSFFLSLKETT